ncbi:MAG: cell division protein PerM [Mycobacteriales bacterium]
MTDLLARPRPRSPVGRRRGKRSPAGRRPVLGQQGRPRSLAWAAAAAAVSAIAPVLVGVELVVLLAWATDPRSGSSAAAAARLGVAVLLVAHHVGVAIPGGGFALPPLGLLVGCALLLRRSVAGAAAARGVRRVPDGVALVGAVAALYGLVLAVLASLARSPALRPSPLQALLAGTALAGVAGGAGLVRACGGHRTLCWLPVRLRQVLTGAAVASGSLVAAGALLVGASLALHGAQVRQLERLVEPNLAGGVALFVLDACLLPNAAIFAAAVLAGPGTALGVGTSVTVHAARIRFVPALPLLAVLPADGRLPAGTALLLLVPALAGVLGGLAVARRLDGGLWWLAAAGWGASAGVVGGAVLAAACALAGGPAGPGRLAAVGPSPWRVGLAAAVVMGVSAAAAAGIAGAVRARRPTRRPTRD